MYKYICICDRSDNMRLFVVPAAPGVHMCVWGAWGMASPTPSSSVTSVTVYHPFSFRHPCPQHSAVPYQSPLPTISFLFETQSRVCKRCESQMSIDDLLQMKIARVT